MFVFKYYYELFVFIIGFLSIYFLLALIPTVILLVSQWKLYTKFGRKGWEAIIPFYSKWVFFELADLKGWYIFLAFIPFVGGAVFLFFNIYAQINIVKKFGISPWYVLGLIFLPIIFYPILAFGKYEPVIFDEEIE